MEGSESEAIFEALNLNPRLFVNETLNSVDDLVDDAFQFFQRQASTLLNTHDTDRSEDLSKGVANVRNVVQSVLDKRLAMWEKYCLHHCFSVPKGFSIPKNVESSVEGLIHEEAICDPDLDAELESLRNKLTAIEKESTVLNRDLQALERHSSSNSQRAAFVNEALELFEQNSVDDLFQEIVQTGSELRTKLLKFKTRRLAESERTKTERIYDTNRDLSQIDSRGFANARLEELLELSAGMKNI